MKALNLIAAGAAALMVVNGNAIAGHADGGKKAYRGTVVCGGNHFIRNGGKEMQWANYVLRNYNKNSPIQIDRIRAYSAQGVLMKDYVGTNMPAARNGVIGSGDNVIDPFQTAHVRTLDILGNQGLSLADRPIQVRINWSAAQPVKLLESSLVRIARERIVQTDPNTGAQTIKYGAERGRHLYECRTISRN